MPSLTAIGAIVGTLLGAINTAWALWQAFLGRARLSVGVDWEWLEPHEASSAPRITIRNHGGHSAYLSEIGFVEENGACLTLVELDNLEVGPGKNFVWRPDWSETREDDPCFTQSWRSLRVMVRDGRGKIWRSTQPATRPSWFTTTSEPRRWLVGDPNGSVG